MSGLGIRLYTDEDVNADLAEQLNNQGYDVLSCRKARNANRGYSDEWQLEFAVSEGRAILVYNIKHFVALDREWQAQSKEHFGIILSPQLRIGELVARTKRHLDTYDPGYHRNLVLQLAP